MTPEAVLAHLKRRLPHLAAVGEPVRLSGGYLNEVWRVRAAPKSVIVKHAPPYVAAVPEIPLDPGRLGVEARALTALGEGGRLPGIATAAIRPPHPLDFDASASILVMEDVGVCPDLGTWLRAGPHPMDEVVATGQRLGRFIGALHARSHADPSLRTVFDNPAIQRTRLSVQYEAVGELCEKAGLMGAAMLGRKAIAFGEGLQAPGQCVIMGDLWPPSVLVTPEGLRVIDWELAHFGFAVQDVAHLAAHLWMEAHRAPTPPLAAQARALWAHFLADYKAALGPVRDTLFGAETRREAALHFGAEVLMRAVGTFQAGYLYDSLPPDDPIVRDALAVAEAHLRTPESVGTFYL